MGMYDRTILVGVAAGQCMMAAAVAGSNSISEPFTAAASQPHFAWALVFTALALAFVLFSLGYGKRRAGTSGKGKAQLRPSTGEEYTGSSAKSLAGQSCSMPRGSISSDFAETGAKVFGQTEGAVIVIGSGIAGLSTAASLHKVGIPVVVLERDPAPREEGSAITFWPNAFRVLDTLGVAHFVRETHSLVHRVEIVDWDGQVLRSFGLDECEGAPHDARIVRRSTLVGALRSAIPPHLIRYGVSVADVHRHEQGAEVELSDGRRLRCKAVVAADGAKSRVAAKLGMKPAAYAGEVYYRGVATFPEGVPEPPGVLRMIWSARGVRVGISSISRTQCFWFTTLTCPEAAKMETPEKRKADALASVSGFAFHIQDAIRNTPADNVSRSRIVDRWLKPGKEVGQSCITVVGDALHPMTPSLGQGGCIALEDGVKLAQALQEAGGASATPVAVAEALREFERERTARAIPVTMKSHMMGAMLQIKNPWFCMARNFIVRNFYPVHSFLKPAAFDCGPLIPDTPAAMPAEDCATAKKKATAPEEASEAEHQQQQKELSLELPREQVPGEKDESSPLHRHGSSQNKKKWPSQTSISIIG